MLSEHAYSIPGFRMISVITGCNPFTGEPVLLTPETLIAGFITLLPGGEATYQELSASGVIPDAAGRIEAALATLGITPELVTSTFLGLWDTLSLDDLLDPLAAFGRVEALFGDPLVRILEFVTVVVQVVVELVLRLMGFPVELLQHIIAETTSAIEDIRNDPMGFLRNLVLALKLGLQSFFDKIGTYLLGGIVGWLFHGLAKLGITIPKDLSFGSILGLILDVLGLSADFLWRKLGEHLGEEKVQQIRDHLDTLGGAWSFIRDVQERGIAAIWEYVQSRLSTLWSTILEIAMKWIVETLVVQGTIKLLGFLDPTFIMSIVNGCIAFYQGVMSTIEYIREILQIIDDYVSTIAAIARGDLTPAAQKVEQGFAEALPVAIGFLAAQLGIGNIPNKIAEIILGIRQVVEAAIDWLIEQALKLGRAILDALSAGGAEPASHTVPDLRERAGQMVAERLGDEPHTDAAIDSVVADVRAELSPLGLHGLEFTAPDDEGNADLIASASKGVVVGSKGKSATPRTPTRLVVLRATVHLGDTAAEALRAIGTPSFSTFTIPRRAGDPRGGIPGITGRQNATEITDVPKSQTQSGAFLLEPDPAAYHLTVVSFNSGFPVPQTNDSHAERFFMNWYTANRGRMVILGVDIDINLSRVQPLRRDLAERGWWR